MKKILFLIQDPNIGGITNMIRLWKDALISDRVSIDIKNVDKDKFSIGNYDIVHLFFSPIYSKSLFIRLIFRKLLKNKKTIVTYYNIKNEPKLKLKLKKIIVNISCNFLALPSKNMLEYYMNNGFFNLIFLPVFSHDNFEKFRKREKSYLSYFGALREDKGVDNLIYVAKNLKEKIHISGIITEDKKSSEYFNQTSRSNNFVTHNNYIEMITKTKIAILPYKDLSCTIDMPLSLLESINLGAVVLTSDISPLNSILPKQCLVNNWKNIYEVKDKLKYLKKNYRKISKEIQKNVLMAGFTKEKFVLKYQRLLSF